MAAGRPVVLAVDGVIRQLVEEAGAGVFVPPGDGPGAGRGRSPSGGRSDRGSARWEPAAAAWSKNDSSVGSRPSSSSGCSLTQSAAGGGRACDRAQIASDRPRWQQRFVGAVWATHNQSVAVRRALADVVASADVGSPGPERGEWRHAASVQRSSPWIWSRSGATDVVADARALPFAAGTFGVVVSQEMVEHVDDPFAVVREMGRVLAAGGWIYLQAPFIIGYHPGSEDYWRFTRAGMRRLLTQAGLDPIRVDRSVAAGTGFYRILVEFLAGAAARLVPGLYLPVEGPGLSAMLPAEVARSIPGRGAPGRSYRRRLLCRRAQAASDPINVLFTSAGRRVELLRAFRQAYRERGPGGALAGDRHRSVGPRPARGRRWISSCRRWSIRITSPPSPDCVARKA